MALVTLVIDGKDVTVPDGVSILEAARKNDIRIPTLCHHPALTERGACRMCVVEVDGSARLAASCVMPVRAGMKVVTVSDRIFETRRTVLEFLFSERNHYCMFCAQSGDCELQSLAYEHGMDHLTVPPLGAGFPTDTTHPDIVMDHNRCVLCGRCVRACREIAGNAVLDFQNRGFHTRIGVDLDTHLAGSSCTSCGACLQVCPTGAIFDRHRTHSAVKGKPKGVEEVESFCPGCGHLCPSVSHVRANELLRIEGVMPGAGPDRGQLCRIGRFDPMRTPGPRLTEPLVREGETLRPARLDEAFERAGRAFSAILSAGGPAALAGITSSRASNEDLSAFRECVLTRWSAGLMDTLDGAHFRTIAAAAEGVPLPEAPWEAILSADFILLAGADTQATHPLVTSLCRRAAMEHGAKLAVVGPANPFAQATAIHLAAQGAEVPALTEALTGDSTPPKGFLDRYGLKGYLDLARLLAQAREPIFIVGPALTGLRDPTAVRRLMELARARGPLPAGRTRLIILKPEGNSASAWNLGCAAPEDLDGRARPRGWLLSLAGEPEIAPGLAEKLAGADFVAVVTPWRTEALSRIAHVLIPRPTWLEADGTFASADGAFTRFKRRVLEPPPGVPDVGKVFSALGAAMR